VLTDDITENTVELMISNFLMTREWFVDYCFDHQNVELLIVGCVVTGSDLLIVAVTTKSIVLLIIDSVKSSVNLSFVN